MKNNLGSSFLSKKNKLKDNNDKDDISDSGEEDINNDLDDEFSYNNFCKLKKKIFQYIENNSAAKEKKKILALIKANKYKKV